MRFLGSVRCVHGTGASIVDADLHCADVSEATVPGADMSEANLRGANMSRADMSEANLHGAKLSGAKLRGANLHGAKDVLQFGPMPTSGRMIYFVQHESESWFRLGASGELLTN